MRVNDPLENTQPLPHVKALRYRLSVANRLLLAVENAQALNLGMGDILINRYETALVRACNAAVLELRNEPPTI